MAKLNPTVSMIKHNKNKTTFNGHYSQQGGSSMVTCLE